MNNYYSHNTSLHLLRVWSKNHPLTVAEFHSLKAGDVGHLPHRALRSTKGISHCANTEADMKRVIEQVDRPSFKRMLGGFFANPPLGPTVHVLTDASNVSHRTNHAVFHKAPRTIPRGALLELAPHIYCSSPEYLFVQMSEALPFGALVALGYELCGCYPLDQTNGTALVRRPLTTPGRLSAFAERASGMHGARLARKAARYVQARAASVTEAEVSILSSMPVQYGGYGLPAPELNRVVELSPAAANIARSDHLVLDAYWPQGRVALEYDGRDGHSEERARIRDSRHRDALAAEGVSVATLTWAQLSVAREFEEIVNFVRKKLGKRKRSGDPKFPERNAELRSQVRRFHSEYWSA